MADENQEIKFPGEPYPVQRDLMNAVCERLEKGGVGIFESPTGTGKSLSLICSSLHWLLDGGGLRALRALREQTQTNQSSASSSSASSSSSSLYSSSSASTTSSSSPFEPDWILEHDQRIQSQRQDQVVQQKQDLEKALKARLRRASLSKATVHDLTRKRSFGSGAFGQTSSKSLKSSPGGQSSNAKAEDKKKSASSANGSKDSKDEDAEFLLDWSDEPSSSISFEMSDSSESEDDDLSSKLISEQDVEEYEERPQIIFCSRTHSQLVQFVGELKRTPYANMMNAATAAGNGGNGGNVSNGELRCVSLGSRKNLCINEEVTQLKSSNRINDKCLDLQKTAGKKKTAAEIADEAFARSYSSSSSSSSKGSSSSSSSSSGAAAVSRVHSACPYLSDATQRALRDHVLAKIHDLEELHQAGSSSGICPYYASRRAVAAAHLITMPYPALLHKPTRHSLGVRLQGNVVIIDEAHNLIESINDVHSCTVTLRDLRRAHAQLQQYLERYQTRLKRCNLVNVRQILDMLHACINYLIHGQAEAPSSKADKTEKTAATASSSSASLSSPSALTKKPPSVQVSQSPPSPSSSKPSTSSSSSSSDCLASISRSLSSTFQQEAAPSMICSKSVDELMGDVHDPFASTPSEVKAATALLKTASAISTSPIATKITVSSHPSVSKFSPTPASNKFSSTASSLTRHSSLPAPSISSRTASLPAPSTSASSAISTSSPTSTRSTSFNSTASTSSSSATPSSFQTQSEAMRINPLIFQLRMDNINLLQVVQYMEQSEIVKKVGGFVEKFSPPEVGVNNKDNSNSSDAMEGKALSSSLGRFQDFVTALSCGADRDGRIVVTRVAPASTNSISSSSCSSSSSSSMPVPPASADALSFRYVLLNPAIHFQEIVEQARAVILCGGTMQPFDHFVTQLFSVLPPERISLFSCGHVVPPENIQGIVLSRGPSDVEFEFTMKRRSDAAMIEELGRCVANMCAVVPGGVIVFFPSYSFEQEVCNHWQRSGIWARISKLKQIFREPRVSSETESILDAFSDCILGKQKGALLTSVVGGKMSEGINFKDDLARCVIMVGLPYPNSADPELKERMTYYDDQCASSNERDCSGGKAYYENLCMRAVNQSVGRAIRHRNDYATIVFADHRYARESVQKALPGWLRSRVRSMGFGEAQRSLCGFFQAKKAHV